MGKGIKVLAAVAVVLNFSGVSSADPWQPNMKLGQLELHPYYKGTGSYDSNIYLVPRDRPDGTRVGGGVLGSWITRNNIGLKLALPGGGMHSFRGGYDFETLNYQTQPKANNAQHHKGNIEYAYKGPAGLTARLSDGYLSTTDPAFSELVDRKRRWQNTGGVSLDYVPDEGFLAAGVSYNHTVHKYLPSDLAILLNRNEQAFRGHVGYMLQPKTKLYLAYSRRIIHYSVHRPSLAVQDKNNKAHHGRVGVEGELTSKLKGRIETGAGYRRYDEPPVGAQTKITRNWEVETNLTYKPVERTTIDLAVARALQESTSGTNRFYVDTNASLAVRHKLPYKLTAGVNLAWAVNKYAEAQTVGGVTAVRRDDLYQQGASLDYDIQEWLSVGASYLHRERNSTFTSQFNYVAHQTAVSLRLQF